MPNASPPLIPPPVGPLFDAAGNMAKAWQAYLYQVFTSTARTQDLEVLEAIDGGGGSGQAALLDQAARLANAAETQPSIPRADLDAARTEALFADPARGSAEEALRRTDLGDVLGPNIEARLAGLEKLIWLVGDPAASAAATLTTLTLAQRFISGTPGTQLASDFFVNQLLSVGAGVFNLLDGTTVVGQVFSIKNDPGSGFNLTVTPFAGQVIDGAVSLVLTPGQAALIQAVGASWKILASH